MFNTLYRLMGIVVTLGALAVAPVSAQTFSNAFEGFGSNDDDPIQIEASELQVEDKNNLAIFTGNVVVTQGEAQLKTHRLKVFYDGQGGGSGTGQRDISRLEASGRVFISSDGQTATGDEASFDMKRDIMVMTGKEVVLSQGPNVVVGNKLTVNLVTGQADLQAAPKQGNNGRIRMLIQPNAVEGN